MKKSIRKITREFAGWYNITEGKEIIFTIVQSGNGSWNLYEKTNTSTGWLDAFKTLKEAKREVI